MEDGTEDEDSHLSWREKMIKMLTIVGQLKRKGKFDMQSEYMRPSSRRSQAGKPTATTSSATNALSEPNGAVDPNLLLFGGFSSNGNKSAATSTTKSGSSSSILDDINGNYQESASSNLKEKVGTYNTPSMFPLEAKLMQPSYALEPASPSSEIEHPAAPQTQAYSPVVAHGAQQEEQLL